MKMKAKNQALRERLDKSADNSSRKSMSFYQHGDNRLYSHRNSLTDSDKIIAKINIHDLDS
jgi:hypothetical protein